MPGPVMVGGWSPAAVTPEARAALDRALAESDLTVTSVLSVRSQVVAGTNYEFAVEGSSASHDQVTRFLVRVFYQPWTKTTELKSVVAAPAPQ
ncbi:E3 ubiquitin-protein ligase mib1 [Phytophthora ramorum]|uniref:Cystatin-like cysteine protease inhibitor EPIC4 n=1 Tax=Phytophthora ramorum TaxID=164328 RepID=UPI0030A6B700|nr:Cystatin-like cysteine protease inhibitor EPIC4 [Phytophthora ramorum]KAH7505730.1 Cystatin-like cysteine protease inhibitor EPIC4 [Phytophthora ramorum]